MKKLILIFVSAMALILGSPVMSDEVHWTAIRDMSTGIQQMVQASKTVFDALRTPIRDYGITNVVAYSTPTANPGAFGGSLTNNGYTQFFSGTYTMPASSIASGEVFSYCIVIQDNSGYNKALVYFNDIEEPYSKGALIVMIPYFFDTTAPDNTTIELYCYNDGTIPSMKISYADTGDIAASYNLRAFVQLKSDILEISSFIYRTYSGVGYHDYYTVAYAAKTTDLTYCTAIQGAEASSTTPSNNGLEYPGSANQDRGYGQFNNGGTAGAGQFINDQVTLDSDAYPTRATVDSIYAAMTGSMLSFFNVSSNLSTLAIDIESTSYPH